MTTIKLSSYYWTLLKDDKLEDEITKLLDYYKLNTNMFKNKLAEELRLAVKEWINRFDNIAYFDEILIYSILNKFYTANREDMPNSTSPFNYHH